MIVPIEFVCVSLTSVSTRRKEWSQHSHIVGTGTPTDIHSHKVHQMGYNVLSQKLVPNGPLQDGFCGNTHPHIKRKLVYETTMEQGRE